MRIPCRDDLISHGERVAQVEDTALVWVGGGSRASRLVAGVETQ